MGTEDLTTYTEGGADIGVISETSDRVTFTVMERRDEVYLWKDHGVNYFGDIEIEFTVELSEVEAGDAESLITGAPACLSNVLGAGYDIRLGTFMKIAFVQNEDYDDQFTLFIQSRTLGGDDGNNTSSVYDIADTPLYITWKRAGTTLTAYIYGSAADRANKTNILETLSCTCNTTDYRYLMLSESENRSGDPTDYVSGYVEDVLIVARDASSNNLKGIFIVRQSSSAALKGIFTVQHTATKDLYAKFEAQATASLKGIFIVQHSSSAALKGILVVYHTATKDLYAKFEAQATASLKGIFIVRHNKFIPWKIHCKFVIIRTPTPIQLAAKFLVTRPGSEDLTAFFATSTVNASPVVLKSTFYVRPDTLMGEDFRIRGWMKTDIRVGDIEATVKKTGRGRLRGD
ncbi:hypothetical protein KKH23_09765 [Patescibacteria group bacterium]|nr:hypothetical protein [Patescibacteria group bacterium]